MRRVIVIWLFLVLGSSVAVAQTETPVPTETLTPTPTPTPTSEPWVYATIAPESTAETIGQMSRFDYVVTAGEVHIANLLTWQLISMWAMFLFIVFLSVWMRRK